jgi:hypothetical protein
MRYRLATACAVCSLAAVLAACGDDDDDETSAGTTTGEAVSTQEFVSQANQICADANEQLAEIPERKFGQQGPAIIEPTLEELSALPVPEDQQEQVDRFIAAGEDGLERLRSEGASEDAFDEFTKAGERLGIKGGCTEA